MSDNEGETQAEETPGSPGPPSEPEEPPPEKKRPYLHVEKEFQSIDEDDYYFPTANEVSAQKLSSLTPFK